jgi:hypothetical protein
MGNIRHGPVVPQNAARSQKPTAATTHNLFGMLSFTRRKPSNASCVVVDDGIAEPSMLLRSSAVTSVTSTIVAVEGLRG